MGQTKSLQSTMTPVLPASQDSTNSIQHSEETSVKSVSHSSNFGCTGSPLKNAASFLSNKQASFFSSPPVRHPRCARNSTNRSHGMPDFTYQAGRFYDSKRTNETRPMTLENAIALAADSYFTGFSWFGSYDPGENIVLVCMESHDGGGSVIKCDGWHSLIKTSTDGTQGQHFSPEDKRIESLMLKEPSTRTNEEIEELMRASRELQCLRLLNSEELRSVWKVFTYQKYSANQRIFEMGEVSKHFAVVWKGSVSVRVPRPRKLTSKFRGKETQVALIESGQFFGETIAVDGGKRAGACVAAQNPTTLLLLDRKSYLKSFHKHVQRESRIKEDFLSQIACFKSWKRKELMQLSFFCQDKTHDSSEVLVSQDKLPENLYIIKTGNANVLIDLRDNNGVLRTLILCVLGAGDVFGEGCVLDDEAVSQYSVRPQSIMEVYSIHRAQVCQDLWKPSDRVMLKLMVQKGLSQHPEKNILE